MNLCGHGVELPVAHLNDGVPLQCHLFRRLAPVGPELHLGKSAQLRAQARWERERGDLVLGGLSVGLGGGGAAQVGGGGGGLLAAPLRLRLLIPALREPLSMPRGMGHHHPLAPSYQLADNTIGEAVGGTVAFWNPSSGPVGSRPGTSPSRETLARVARGEERGKRRWNLGVEEGRVGTGAGVVEALHGLGCPQAPLSFRKGRQLGGRGAAEGGRGSDTCPKRGALRLCWK